MSVPWVAASLLAQDQINCLQALGEWLRVFL